MPGLTKIGLEEDDAREYQIDIYHTVIADDATREREFGNLRLIKDNYPKYVISMTPLLTKNDDNGITHIHLRKFLAEGV